MGFISMADAVSQLRTLLSDGPADKIVYQKKCFGKIDGVNTSFKTFEYRRVTDFTAPAAGFGVYQNSVFQAGVTSDDLSSGQFVLTTPPVDGDVIEATYYYQWFIDTELSQFILNALSWLGLGSDPTQADDGLIPAILNFGQKEAYAKLAVRWSIRMAETYQLEDAPDAKNMGVGNTYRDIAKNFADEALKLRDQFYTRQGRSLSPLFGVNAGAVRDYMPKR